MKTAMVAAALAALSLSGVALADDVTGAWKVTGDVVGNAVATVCTFAGSGDKTTASCTENGAAGKPAPVTISGKDVSWDWETSQAVLTFKGKLDSASAMKGDIEVSGVTGNFTATKQ